MDWIDEIASAWRREYPALDSSAMLALVRVARLAVQIDRLQCAVLEPSEISAADSGVLAMLRRSGKPYRSSPRMLYSRLQRSSGGMTKMLERLEDRGLVRRLADPEDGRGLLVELTRPGLRLQERIFNAFLSASNELLAGLGLREKREIDDSSRTLLAAFDGYLGAEEGEA